jgi:hypothetical protein
MIEPSGSVVSCIQKLVSPVFPFYWFDRLSVFGLV